MAAVPTILTFSWDSGNRIFFAGHDATASAISGVTSPIIEFAITIPMGPMI